MQTTLALVLTLSALPVSPPAAPAAISRAEDSLDLKGAMDHSVRWLRSKQDAQSGAYGGALEPTAWTLLALARCPRHYGVHDGPFVKRGLDYLLGHCAPDGSIHSADANEAERLAQTELVAIVLGHHVTPESARALSNALSWFGEQDSGTTSPRAAAVQNPALAQLTLDKASMFATATLARCASDGSWAGSDTNGGAVQATARAVIDLAECYGLLQPKTPPRSVSPLPRAGALDGESLDRSIIAGARFLVGAADDGLWGAPGQPDAGISAMVLAALHAVPEPRPTEIQNAIDHGLAWLAGLQREDGSIHDGKLYNYVTSASILALARAGDRYQPQLVKARDFLISLQSDEGEGYSPDHHYYGGVGYGGDERPDLSNLQMALEALSASGLESEHAAYQRALTFLERCQNRSESNDLALDENGTVLIAGEDGGAAYSPGASPAGFIELEDGKKIPRSYGSMSYALLKSYIFAGLERDDPRVEALWNWLQENYTLDVNPGFQYVDDPVAAYQGLFYYFNTMARALDLYGAETIVDAAGAEHAWRTELAGRLVAMQSRVDGSWVNGNAPRWWEGNPVLATAYALATLELTRAD
ncbi:MAG: squalene-hopene/tetraprenyl-beta-curcumene cyclase [Chlamydiales bacterium]|jgi:squalene-hopene/tetraprenyl-beta-curcumene cyclase